MSERTENEQEQRPVAEMGFEAARDELIQVVRMLESGGQDLDTSLTMWERGEELAARCEEHLAGARKRIDAVLAEKDGGASPSPSQTGAVRPS